MARPTDSPRWARTSGGTPSALLTTPTILKLDTGFAAGEKPPAQTINYILDNHARWLAFLDLQLGQTVAFGDGNDGAATIDGSNTFSWAAKVGSVYTLNRDVNLTTVILGSGVTVNTNGWIFSAWSVDATAGTNVLCADGLNGSGQTGGAGITGRLCPSASGLAGTTGSPASNAGSATNIANCIGGTTSVGGGPSPATGTGTVPAASSGNLHAFPSFISGILFGSSNTVLNGGVPGAGGGAGAGGTGGGGGAGGGILVACIGILSCAATTRISANGGNAGNGAGTSGGGGGGGGGGAILLTYHSLPLGFGTVAVTGGTGGTASGTGTAGSAGSGGHSYAWVV